MVSTAAKMFKAMADERIATAERLYGKAKCAHTNAERRFFLDSAARIEEEAAVRMIQARNAERDAR